MNSAEFRLDMLHRLADEIWVDQLQLMRKLGLRSCVDPRPAEAESPQQPRLRGIPGGRP